MVAWLHSKITTITGAAAILAGASLASKLLGLVRNRVLAGLFGAGDELDAYFAAFRIPDAIFQFVVLGALSAGFIPIFIELIEKSGKSGHSEADFSGLKTSDDPWHVVSSVINGLMILLVLLSGIFIVFAPAIQGWVAPGFEGEKFLLTVRLARIMAIGPIFLGISAVFSGILQAYRRFYIYALAPLFYNLGIILGAVWMVAYFGPVGLAYGVVLGTIMHMMVQIPTVRNVGFRWKRVLDIGNYAVRRIVALSLPRVAGLAVAQINFFIITILASKLASGSLSVFNLANDIQNVPIGLFGISIATAAFPAFSSFAARSDWEGFRNSLSSTTRLILFLTIPFTVLLLLLRAQLTRIFLGWGAFDWSDTIATADTLAFFALSLFAQALLPLFARALYALKDTFSPLIAGAVGVVVNLTLALQFRGMFGIAGLALAFSIASIANVLIIWVVLRMRTGALGDAQILVSLTKLTAAAFAMGIVVQSVKPVVAAYVDMQTGLGILTQGAVSGVFGLAVFLLVALAMGSEEAVYLKGAFSRHLLRDRQSDPSEIAE